MFENVKEIKEIPFFGSRRNILKSIEESSSARKISFFRFVFRKSRNILLYRMAYFCPLNSLRVKMHKWRGVQIGKEVFIDKQCSIDNAYPEYVYIGDNVCINMGCVIVAHTAPSPHFEGVIRSLVSPVVIHDYTLIGINATILPGVIIGRSAIVAAGSVVEHDVPEYTIVQGNPVKTKINFERFLVNKK